MGRLEGLFKNSLDMTYDSNAIEGNMLTLKETYLVINDGLTVKGKSLKDHLEAKNHHEAIHFLLYELVEHDKKHTVSERLIRSLQLEYLLNTLSGLTPIFTTKITGILTLLCEKVQGNGPKQK